MTPIEHSDIGNRLLGALPLKIFATLVPHLRRVELVNRATLHLPDAVIDTVYFPETGYVSMIAVLENGDAAEVGMVGREGMVGLPLVYGTDRSPVEAMVQSEGTAFSIEADAFRRALETAPALLKALLRYAMAFGVQVTMTAACNVQHLVDQRIARWLLMAHDRSDGDEFPMTHEFLSMMLGVRRAGVTVAAGALQKAGFISYSQGRIRIADRPGLESAACECHTVVSREFNRLLGGSAKK